MLRVVVTNTEALNYLKKQFWAEKAMPKPTFTHQLTRA